MVCAIRASHLSKRYRITRGDSGRGDASYSYRTLRESLQELVTSPWRRLRGVGDPRTEDFWALRDIDFEIQPGEVVGVVGHNGAGKSTFLKVLSRITKPTSGHAELHGRVGSLLEVGTGFHPELTGSENIYLNGAILGMSRREIARKFDEIVAFAEVEAFLETPVKRYSSGMFVRLAFAVAAHLEPEILIVDEVLAVGDIAFQRKCMNRMSEVGQSGCTVLFVSHNMPAVESLCTRGILLEAGRVIHDGEVSDVVREYRRHMMALQLDARANPFERPGARRHHPVFRSAALLDAETGDTTNYVPLGGVFDLRIGLRTEKPIELPTIGIGIDDTLGQRLLTLHTPLNDDAITSVADQAAVHCRVDPFPLAPGEYALKLALSSGGAEVDSVDGALHFTVVNGEAFGEGRGFSRGTCVAPSRWRLAAGPGQEE